MVEEIAKNQEDSEFRDDIGPIFHSDRIGVHMLSTSTTLLEGIQQGNSQAIERFMRRYGDPCRCYYEAGWGFDHETAETLTIEVLMKLVEKYKLHSYHFRDFHSYLFESLDKHAIDKQMQYFNEVLVDIGKLKLKMKDSETAFKSRFETISLSYSEHKSTIKNIQDGNEEAQELFIQWYNDLCHCYYEAIGEFGWGFDHEIAETLTTEVLEQLIKKDRLDSYSFPSFRSYLFRILRNYAIDYYRKKKSKKDPLNGAISIESTDGQPIGMPVEDQLPEDKVIGEPEFMKKRVRIILADAIKLVKAEERTNRDKEKAKAQDEKADGKFQDGGYIPLNVHILVLMMNKRGQTSVEIANKINEKITNEEKKLTPDAVRGRATTARGRLRIKIRKHLREEGMTDEEIDDEITDLLSCNLSDLNIAKLLKIGTDSPKVLDELERIAKLPPQEIWSNISFLCSELGWKRPKTVIAQLLDIPLSRVDRWFSQQKLSKSVRRRIAALCVLMAILACGKLNSLHEQELCAIIKVLRGLADHTDDDIVRDVISILKSELSDLPSP
jgi:DNA-directed RNA polymerase specialized sigma24 family protein